VILTGLRLTLGAQIMQNVNKITINFKILNYFYIYKQKTVELISTHICKGSEIGVHNNMFGGILMAYLDESAGAFASQLCDTPRMVTKKVEEIVFMEPVRLGNILKIYGEPVRVGNSSITVALEVRKHNVHTGIQKVVCSTKMVFVKIDDEGCAVPISDKAKVRVQLKMNNNNINMN